MTIIIPSPQLLIHGKKKEYVTQISQREHKSRNLSTNFNSLLDDCTINLSLMCFNGINPGIHQARVYSSVIISDFIDFNNPKNPLFYGSLAASANDYENAVYWYKIAARRKSVTAMNAIGHIYLKIHKEIQNRKIQKNPNDKSNDFLDIFRYKTNRFYREKPSDEALKWFFRAYKFGSIQSLQYIAMVYEEIQDLPKSLHFYFKHYEKTIAYSKMISDNLPNSDDNFYAKLNFTDFSSLYSKYKIGRILSLMCQNDSAFIWFASCAECFGHLKSVKRMLQIASNEKESKNKTYSKFYSIFLNKLKEIKSNEDYKKKLMMSKIISFLKPFADKQKSDESNSGIENSNENKSASKEPTKTNSSDNKSNIKLNSKPEKSSSEIESSSDSLIEGTAIDLSGWNLIESQFDSLLSSTFYSGRTLSPKRLEIPAFKSLTQTFWLIEPLICSSRNVVHYESSTQTCSGASSTNFERCVFLRSADSELFGNSGAVRSVTIPDHHFGHTKPDPLMTLLNSSTISKTPLSPHSIKKMFPSIDHAFFPSGTKTQYLHFAFKFASPSFVKRNLHLTQLFLQKMWMLHPKGISESVIFRNKCKSRNPKHLVQCGFISILCHDSKFALDLFTRAAKLGNETGSLMTGLLTFHGLNVPRNVRNGCYFLSQCATNPIALLHLSLACNDEVYEARAMETLGMANSKFVIKNRLNLDNDPLEDDQNKCIFNSRYKMYEWVGDLFSNSVKLPFNVGIALMFYGIAMKKAENDGDDINEIIKKISVVSRENVVKKS